MESTILFLEKIYYLNQDSHPDISSIFKPDRYKHRMYKGKPLHLPLSGERHLTSNDKARLKQATEDLQKEAKESYFQITSEMPVLGYLKTGNPKKKELDEAFLKIEEKIRGFFKESQRQESGHGFTSLIQAFGGGVVKRRERLLFGGRKGENRG